MITNINIVVLFQTEYVPSPGKAVHGKKWGLSRMGFVDCRPRFLLLQGKASSRLLGRRAREEGKGIGQAPDARTGGANLKDEGPGTYATHQSR